MFDSRTVCGLVASILLAWTAGARAGTDGDIVYVYLNRCAAGCPIQPGFDNALTGRSSIVNQATTVGPSTYDDAVFDATVACVTEVLAPFDVQVVTSQPVVPHHQLIVAGTPTQAGFPNGVGGVAPYLPGVTTLNAIGFVFAGALGPDADQLCWIAAQQLGSMYGLDITYHCADVMSYRTDCPIADKTFTDVDAQCGAFMPRTCMDGMPTQNSFAQMLVRTDAASRVFRDGFED